MRVSTHHFDLYIPVRGDTHRGILDFYLTTDTNQGGVEQCS